MKDKKYVCSMTSIFPDKAVVAQVFWHIISSNTFGYLVFSILLAIEDIILLSLTILLGLKAELLDSGLQSSYSNPNMP